MERNFIEIGVNHFDAPVSLREKLIDSQVGSPEWLAAFRREMGLGQLVVLSTCSRFEVYAYSDRPDQALQAISRWFEKRAGPQARTYLRSRRGTEALTHLFRVASGLESWILGESEILGQIKKAYHAAQAAGLTGAEFNRIFQSALAAGKASRARTGLQDGIRSIGGAAALLARRIFGEDAPGDAAVFGAGDAAQSVCRHLAAKNFSRILVANRTRARAEELASSISGQAVDLADGLGRLGEIQVAVFSLSCAEPVVTEAWLRARGAGRARPLFLIDLGVPRNVAPECASVPGVVVYDLDDLKEIVSSSMMGKSAAVRQADGLVREAVEDCAHQLFKARARGAERAFLERVG